MSSSPRQCTECRRTLPDSAFPRPCAGCRADLAERAEEAANRLRSLTTTFFPSPVAIRGPPLLGEDMSSASTTASTSAGGFSGSFSNSFHAVANNHAAPTSIFSLPQPSAGAFQSFFSTRPLSSDASSSRTNVPSVSVFASLFSYVPLTFEFEAPPLQLPSGFFSTRPVVPTASSSRTTAPPPEQPPVYAVALRDASASRTPTLLTNPFLHRLLTSVALATEWFSALHAMGLKETNIRVMAAMKEDRRDALIVKLVPSMGVVDRMILGEFIGQLAVQRNEFVELRWTAVNSLLPPVHHDR
ncbi:hypothetical protein C8R43DRAFT_956847 [Mycena crocata]|nr:hypothetical protein C8R43DRAFT_956847 [Mycena crocata]